MIILEAMRIIAIALSPVTPSLSWRIYGQLGYSRDQFDAATWVSLKDLLHMYMYFLMPDAYYPTTCLMN